MDSLVRSWLVERLGRREVLQRLGIWGLGVPAATGLLAACSPPPVAPTAAPPSVPAPSAVPKPATPPVVVSPLPSPAAKAAASPTASAATPISTKPKAIIGIVQEPTSLDPTAAATASIATTLRDNVYEGLVRLDGSGKIVGSLAKSWDVSQDGKTFTFRLVNGAKWHDGSPFTSEDVKFSWERAKDPNTKPVNPHRDYWDPVQTIEVPDPSTVKVTLSTYSDNWLFHMAAGSAVIVSSKSATANDTNPVGTGPFKYSGWNRGAALALTRNDEYWGTKAPLKDVEFRFISDPNAMNNALKAGDIDAIGQVQGPEQLAGFEQDQGFTVVKGPAAGKVMVSVNNTSGPLADKRVRQALYAAIDRKAWIDGIAAGYGEPIGSHATPNDGEPYHVDVTSANSYNPARAKQLLSEAGHTNLTLRLAQISVFPYAVRGSEILSSQLQAVGVTLKIEPMEFPRWLQQVFLNAQDYDLTIINHVEERDIGNFANPKYYWHYDNPAVAASIKQADAEPNEVKRKELYATIQRQLADDAAGLWVYAPNQLAVLRKNFQGYQVQGISPSLYLGGAYFSSAG